MSQETQRRFGLRHPWRRAHLALRPSGLASAALVGLAAVLAAGLAVVFAATLAVAMAVATTLLGLTALAWRMRRPGLREARIVRQREGHAWVGYDWDRDRR